MFEVASSKEVTFSQTFEHLVIHFDNAFVSLLQLNIQSIQTAKATIKASISQLQQIIKKLSPAVELHKPAKVESSLL